MNPTTGHHIGRNDPCHCGSGRKYKQCCLDKDEAAAREANQPAPDASSTNSESATAAPRSPKHQTHQPWKKSAANTHGFHRVSLPRKVGGS